MSGNYCCSGKVYQGKAFESFGQIQILNKTLSADPDELSKYFIIVKA